MLMNRFEHLGRPAAWVCLGIWLVTTRDAQAYIDPGAGSYLFQILIAGLTALVFFFSALRRKAVAAIKRLFGNGDAANPAEVEAKEPLPPKP